MKLRRWAAVTIAAALSASGGCASGTAHHAGTAPRPVGLASPQVAGGATVPAGGGTTNGGNGTSPGCSLVSRSEASAAVGHPLGAGTEAPTHLAGPVTAHRGCHYGAGSYGVGYDLNTIQPAIPVATYEQNAWSQLAKQQKVTHVTIGGNPGITYQFGNLQAADFYRGNISVVVLTSNAKPGGALAVATLIAQRM